MAHPLGIYVAQINSKMGHISGNAEKILSHWQQGRDANADVVVMPECAICGYPPEDLLFKRSFVDACMEAVKTLADETLKGPALLVGTPWRAEGFLFNTAVLIKNGQINTIACKQELPNYGVFDEQRYFQAGMGSSICKIGEVTVGLAVCEDLWFPPVAKQLEQKGAEVILALNASPFDMKKLKTRTEIVRYRADETQLPILYVNAIGGQDELVFDGHSFAQNPNETAPAFMAAGFEEDAFMATFQNSTLTTQANLPAASDGLDALDAALCCGVRDYVHGNGFKEVVIGLSGGIDSALAAALAVRSLGADSVTGLLMPSPYSSVHSLEDAEKLAENLGIKTHTVPIDPGMKAFDTMLGGIFKDTTEDVTEENIQARVRGALLMAYSNKFGGMLLSTGNKSELSVGYSTLYGDMNGGFNPLKDLYKTTVFELCKHLNKDAEIIPENIISKPPSAELRPNQLDSDTLPDYDTLDTILKQAIEEHKSVDEIAQAGIDKQMAEKIMRMLRLAEYKRRQACPGVKVSHVAFGRDFRFPITNSWRV
mgnify:CR=1 FL=1